jgi:signal transduction histidine kinase
MESVCNPPLMRPVPSVLDLASHRLALPRSHRGLIDAERVLAAVRAVLAFSSILLIWFDPAQVSPYSQLVLTLLFLYQAHAIWLLLLVHLRNSVSTRFSLLAHATDILWPAVISLFAGGSGSPFFLYFIFALLAAAFRWGMRETSLTTVAVVLTMAGDAVAIARTPLGQMLGQHVDVTHFVMRAAYLVIFAFLIGYVAEAEKRRAAEAMSISQITAKVRIEAGLKGTVQTVLQEILQLFGGRELLVITRESEADRVMLWRAEELNNGSIVFTWRQLDEAEEQEYLFVMGGETAGAVWRNSNAASSINLDKNGMRTRDQKCYLAARFVDQHRFESLMACAILAAPDVSARILLFEPSRGGRAETQLRFLQDLANLVAPSVYNVYLLRRLRSRAAAVERARVARELHDGVVQSLHAIAFRLYALRTRSTFAPGEREQEILDIQQLVQNEAANVRNLIQQLEPLDFDPRHLVDFLAGMVTRYRQDTGIGAQFVCDRAEVNLPAATCRELAGILREALANVRRHSGAQNVLVRLGRDRGGWMLTVEDDGRGFEFSGKFSHAELEDSRRGPLVIKQRVRAINGELTIISRAGQGARLEIKIPDLARASIA